MKDAYRHIKDDCQLKQVLCQEAEEIKRCAFQSINLMTMAESALSHTYKDCIFIGCQLPMGLKKNSKDCLFLPDMGETFRYRNHLYTPEELYEGYSPAIKGSYEKCFDGRVYKHYLKKGKRSTDAKETLAHCMTIAFRTACTISSRTTTSGVWLALWVDITSRAETQPTGRWQPSANT